MTRFILALASLLFLAACSTPVAEQVRRLQLAAPCCAALTDLQPVEVLSAEISGELSESSRVVSVGGSKTPAIMFRLPEGSAGRVLEIHATPDMGAVTEGGSLIFTPISVVFLAADGSTVAPSADSDLNAAHGGVMYLFILARQARIPSQAVSAVFYADPARIGKSQTMQHQTTSYLMPAGGILIPIAGRSSVKAIYAVYGKFSAKLL